MVRRLVADYKFLGGVKESPTGQLVYYEDYQQLEQQLAQVTAEKDKWAELAGSFTQGHREKLVELEQGKIKIQQLEQRVQGAELGALQRAKRALDESFFAYDIEWWRETPKKEVFLKACQECSAIVQKLIDQVKG